MSLLKQNRPAVTAPRGAVTGRPQKPRHLRPAASKLVEAAHKRQQSPGIIARLIAKWKASRAAAKTRRAEEAADKAERQRRKEMRRQLEDEAYFYMDRITGVTARMSSLSYRYKKTERDVFESGVQTITFADMVLQPEAIYLRVDTDPGRLPRNVSMKELAQDEALFNFSMSCGHKVLCEYYEDGRGFWYIVERQSGVRGIPIHVRMDEMWSMRGPTHDGLSVPFGIGVNKKPVWRSLSQMLSLLIAGTPGSGKSNLMNVILSTYIRFNSPRRLKLALVDLKTGLEFGPYSEVPHLMRYRPTRRDEPTDDVTASDDVALDETIVQNTEQDEDDEMIPALVEAPADVLPLLRAIHREGRRRGRLLRQAGERGINAYNWKNAKRALPHLVVFIDELAELQMLPSKELGRVETLLVSIGQTFRAVGIHLVLATQTPKKEIISIMLQNAIPAHVAFSCPNAAASQLIIGNGSATDLSPQGRCILDWSGKQMELQAPLIPDRMISSIIDGAMRGEYEEFEPARHDVTEEEIFQVGLEEFGGNLPYHELYHWFSKHQRGISRPEIERVIRSYGDKEIAIGSSIYKVIPMRNGKPASLKSMDEEPTP
jgi:hypothetical protein